MAAKNLSGKIQYGIGDLFATLCNQSKMVDSCPDIILQQTNGLVTKMPKLTVTPLHDDDNVEEFNQQFEELQTLLKQCTKDCLLRARKGAPITPICIHIKGMKQLSSNVELTRGDTNSDTNCKRHDVLDEANQFLAYETKSEEKVRNMNKKNKNNVNAVNGRAKSPLSLSHNNSNNNNDKKF